MDKSQMGDDIGRIPNTIILPAWEDYPPGLKMKAKLLWRKFTDTVVGMSTLIYAAKWDVPKDKRTGKSKRHPLSLNKRVELGLAYHSLLNTGLANGSLRGLKIMCASGLYDHCKKLIDEAKEQGYARKEWVLVSYEGIQYPQWLVGIWPLSVFLPNAHARVVSDRVVAVPFGKQSYLRECIVRIKSVQLVRIQTDRDPIIHQDRRTEHIVLQKINLDGEEGEWKVWGTIDPSKEELHDILDGKHQDSSPNSFVQEFKSRVSSLSGMNF
ncbi:uncharacterized protein A1O9_08636 [Exophiala aquamarina CBS 119918]|uniref:Uncharacterized protein n=1 Tax=Exophiala aquamarina CBS 119918 TaxID=1182545 RepID=A0A072P4F6_9EURO|nr:uncharacterized protein A1O9_08636 [Exophiala aquamarina CBS 119918]KEF54984.1 hypothetical protein A1O9_08636 [Exophiala aquamarina CBS 119918]